MSNHKNIMNKANHYSQTHLASTIPVGQREIDTSGMEHSALTDLANRLNSAIQSKSTSFTMSVGEAGAVFAAITEIISLNAKLNQTVFEMQNQVLKEKSTISRVVADAGGFK